MARPIKEGLDYFTLDCHFDDKVELVIAEFGMTGLGILIRLFQKIYSDNGYYCCWNDDVALLFSQKNGLSGNVVPEVISACIRRGVFDCGMYQHYSILTSKGIQTRYLEASKRRTSLNLKNDYLLIDIPSNKVNVDNNSINVDINSKKDSNNTQSKVNKSKSNKSKSNKSKSNKSKSNCSSAAAHREILNKEYSEKDKTELYFNTQLTVAEYDYLYHHIAESEFDNYISRIQNYSKCKSRFETILKWAIDDGNYHD